MKIKTLAEAYNELPKSSEDAELDELAAKMLAEDGDLKLFVSRDNEPKKLLQLDIDYYDLDAKRKNWEEYALRNYREIKRMIRKECGNEKLYLPGERVRGIIEENTVNHLGYLMKKPKRLGIPTKSFRLPNKKRPLSQACFMNAYIHHAYGEGEPVYGWLITTYRPGELDFFAHYAVRKPNRKGFLGSDKQIHQRSRE